MTTKPVLSVNVSNCDLYIIWKIQNFEQIAFKIVQMKFLAMHITFQKWSFDILTVRNSLNIFMEHDIYLKY